MKTNLHLLRALMVLGFMAALTPLAPGANSTWSGSSGTDLFWSTAGNWLPGGSPGANNDALFFDAGATNDNVSATSVVTGNTTIHALRFGETNANFHNLLINSGVTLTIAGANDNGYGPLGVNPAAAAITNGLSTLYSGSWPGVGVATAVRVTNTISGPGALVLNNTHNELLVRYCNGANVVHYSILDMSGLNSLTANLARIGVGYGQPGDTIRAMGTLLLAQTNTITLSGTNFQDISNLIVGDNTGNNDGNSTTAFLYLGNQNTLNADKILIGGEKTPGQVLFNAVFASPSLVLRGSDGVSRVSAIRLGDESDAGATGSPNTGTLNLLAGTSDILAETIIVGRGQNGSGGTTASTGNLLIGSGKLDVNNLQLAEQFNAAQGGVMTGTATFSNTTVVVNKLLRLGHFTGGTGARNATLNIAGGSFTVMSNLVTEGAAKINVTNSVLALPANQSMLASIINLDGGAISNAATLTVTNTLTIVDSGMIIGNPIFDMGNNNASAVWNVQGTPTGGLVIGNAFQGSGTVNGDLIQNAGATLSPGGSGAAGTLTVNGNLTLNAGTLRIDLSNSGSGVNDQLNVSGNVLLSGTNAVNLSALSGAFDTVNPYTLITAGSLVGGDQTYFVPAGGLGQSRYIFSFDTSTGNSVKLTVAGAGPANLIWIGDGSLNNWDLKTTPNWNNGTPNQQFFSLDAVTFNDNGSASPAVNLVGTLNPGSITVDSAKNYAFNGTGGLTGAGLAKSGTGSLTFNNIGDVSFGGLVAITNGAATLNNTGLNTFVNGLAMVGGSVTLAGGSTNNFAAGTSVAIGVGTSLTVANANANTFNGASIELDGSLIVTQAVDSVMDAVIAGAGTLTKTGSGALTLSGINSGLSSVVQINGGTIKAATTSALGPIGAIITNGATLDLNGQNLGALPVTVSGSGMGGNGAIVSIAGILLSGSSGIGLNNVTLTGNTIVGGSGPWDTDPIRNVGVWGISAGTLSTGGSNYSLTKVGLNQVSLNGATVDAALGDIDVQQGLLDLAGGTTSLGNPTNTITVRAGAALSFNTTTTSWDKKFVIFGDGVAPNILNYNGVNTVIGSVTLNGDCVASSVPANRGAPVSITLSGPVSGTGNLIKSGVDALILGGTNTYSGTTTVSGGSLIVDGINLVTNVVTVSGGTLGGTGAISGPVTILSGGTLSPGDTNTALSTLSISNRLNLGGTCAVDLDKTAGVLTGDLVADITALTLGGTLQLNLTGDPLVSGDSLRLFSFVSASGAFLGIIPDSPGTGLQWDTSHLTADGTLRVVTGNINTTPTNITAIVSGNQLNLSWPADHTGWRLQVQTNPVSQGLSPNWFDVPGSTTVNSLSFTVDPANGTVFYRMVYP